MRSLSVNLAAARNVAAVDVLLPEVDAGRSQPLGLLAVGAVAGGASRVPPLGARTLRRGGGGWRGRRQGRGRTVRRGDLVQGTEAVVEGVVLRLRQDFVRVRQQGVLRRRQQVVVGVVAREAQRRRVLRVIGGHLQTGLEPRRVVHVPPHGLVALFGHVRWLTGLGWRCRSVLEVPRVVVWPGIQLFGREQRVVVVLRLRLRLLQNWRRIQVAAEFGGGAARRQAGDGGREWRRIERTRRRGSGRRRLDAGRLAGRGRLGGSTARAFVVVLLPGVEALADGRVGQGWRRFARQLVTLRGQHCQWRRSLFLKQSKTRIYYKLQNYRNF